MNARQKLAEQAEALDKARAELIKACDATIAAIDAAEARRDAEHDKTMSALDAILDLIDKFSKPKEIAKTDHPVGIAFTEGVGIREVKP